MNAVLDIHARSSRDRRHKAFGEQIGASSHAGLAEDPAAQDPLWVKFVQWQKDLARENKAAALQKAKDLAEQPMKILNRIMIMFAMAGQQLPGLALNNGSNMQLRP